MKTMTGGGRLRTMFTYLLSLLAWQLLAEASKGVIPGPLDIAAAYAERDFILRLASAYSLTAFRAAVGFLLGLTAGLGLGLVAAYARFSEDIIEGFAAFTSSIPSVAWIPLLIASMGVNEYKLPIIVSFLCSFPPILYQTLSALRAMDHEQIMVARTLGARGWFLWRTIILPSILEKVFPAVKIEAAMVWKTVFAAEMVAVPSGLGYLAMMYADLLDVKHVAAIVLLLAATVAAVVRAASLAEKALLKKRGLGVSSWQLTLEL